MAEKQEESPEQLKRLKEIRTYRNLKQDDFAEWLGLRKQSIGKKERGDGSRYSLSEIKKILEHTDIDARYLFGQIERIEDADLRSGRENESLAKELLNEVKAFRQLNTPKEDDRVVERVRASAKLRQIVERIYLLSPADLEIVDGMIHSYFYVKRDHDAGQVVSTERAKPA